MTVEPGSVRIPYREAIIEWTPAHMTDHPTAGQMRVIEWIVSINGPRTFSASGVAVYAACRRLRGWECVAQVFIDFNNLVVCSGIDPQVAHAAFMRIAEYAEHHRTIPTIRAGVQGPRPASPQ